jgi:parallel beta-helix repeat protein
MRLPLSLLCLVALGSSPEAMATTRVVPTEQPSIQGAIDASQAGDTVLVQPGLYRERIQFRGRALTVRSIAGPESTIIDGGGAGTVVDFAAVNDGDCVFEGFTVTGGAHPEQAGGVHIEGASPTLRHNIIRGNAGGRLGHGISLVDSDHALIESNQISANRSWAAGNGAGGGGGIGVLRGVAVEIRGNQIQDNRVDRYSSGGGIYLFDSGATQIVGNRIIGNDARLAGAGIAVHGRSDARIENNLIVDNRVLEPGTGGGVHWLVFAGSGGPALIGNTIVGNQAHAGAGVYADGEDSRARIVNNLVLAASGGSAIECGDYSDLLPPIVHHNNALSDVDAYAGLCDSAVIHRANLSTPPRFIAGTWQLAPGSAGIDGGDAGATRELLDLAGNLRRCASDDVLAPAVDIGAFEYCGR